MAETSYEPCGDLSLAYRVFGDGPVELVYTGSLVSHVELCWTVSEFKASMGHCQLEQSEGDFRPFASAIHQVACDL